MLVESVGKCMGFCGYRRSPISCAPPEEEASSIEGCYAFTQHNNDCGMKLSDNPCTPTYFTNEDFYQAYPSDRIKVWSGSSSVSEEKTTRSRSRFIYHDRDNDLDHDVYIKIYTSRYIS